MNDDDVRLGRIEQCIRDVPDFPKPGILFKDITPLLASPDAFREAVTLMADHYRELKLDALVAVESRGFVFGSALAMDLSLPLAIVRKSGKLPWKTHGIEYALEYGTDKLEIHQDAVSKGSRVAVIDDLLATGGTAAATIKLCKIIGAEVVDCGFLIELAFLSGRKAIDPIPSFSLLRY